MVYLFLKLESAVWLDLSGRHVNFPSSGSSGLLAEGRQQILPDHVFVLLDFYSISLHSICCVLLFLLLLIELSLQLFLGGW